MCLPLLILGTADPVDVLTEGEEELLSVDRPHFDGLVVGRRDQRLSVCREVDASHGARVSAERRGLSLPTQNTHKTYYNPPSVITTFYTST